MITLTREEAQQVLDALEKVTKQMLSARDELAERGARPVTNTHHQKIWDRASEAYTDQAIPAAETLRARLSAPEPEPVAYLQKQDDDDAELYFGRLTDDEIDRGWTEIPLYTAPPQRERAQFPTMLRKMWSGAEVQAWLDENVNKERT